jgi:hypothetical protein
MVYGVVHRGSPALLYNYCRIPRRAVERRRGILRRVPCNRVSLVVGSVAQELPSHPSKESQLVAMHPAVTTRACGAHQPHPQASTLLGVLAISLALRPFSWQYRSAATKRRCSRRTSHCGCARIPPRREAKGQENRAGGPVRDAANRRSSRLA